MLHLGRNMKAIISKKVAICAMSLFTLCLVLVPARTLATGDKVFSIPMQQLDQWSNQIVNTLTGVKITGNSGVHNLQNDCEMHFGAISSNFQGDPSGLVLEPMNLCEMPFFKKTVYRKSDWTNFAKSLRGKTVTIAGVPRIWPEHLLGSRSPSNPNHAVEFHPLTKLSLNQEIYDFSSFVYCPESYRGGVGEQTANKIVKDIEVGVIVNGQDAEIDVDIGRIGNFAALDVRIFKDMIVTLSNGHKLEGEVVLGRGEVVPVHMVSIKGSDIDQEVENFKTGKKNSTTFEALILFSLSPEELFKAAKESEASHKREIVSKPLQLILFGPTD